MMGHRRKVAAAGRIGPEAAEIAKRIRGLAGRHSAYDIFRDWVTSMALSIANAVDPRPAVWRAREDEYMRIVDRLGAETMRAFAEMQALVVIALEAETSDLLGEIYMALELSNADAGQFFTPFSLCTLMAELTATPEEMRAIVEREGFITKHEPAIGGGAMVITFVAAMQRAGLNPAKHLHVTGVDIDRKVLCMAYVQLSLLGVPAVLIVGDSLRMELGERWYTPVHVLEGWSARLALRRVFDLLRGPAELEERIHADQTASADLRESDRVGSAASRDGQQLRMFEMDEA